MLETQAKGIQNITSSPDAEGVSGPDVSSAGITRLYIDEHGVRVIEQRPGEPFNMVLSADQPVSISWLDRLRNLAGKFIPDRDSARSDDLRQIEEIQKQLRVAEVQEESSSSRFTTFAD